MTPSSSDRTVGYLGPAGTFTEQAIFSQHDLAAMRLVQYDTIAAALRATDRGEVDFGFVAIENMIEGSVSATHDTLAFDSQALRIQREVIINVNLNLLATGGMALTDVRVVRSHPMALAQTRRFLADHLPGATVEVANSTADAARELAESARTDMAAIAPQRSADVYGLATLAAGIEDHPENQTRFVLVARDTIPSPTGEDKTSVLVHQRADAPGSLVGILHEFAARSISLSRLESRPTRRELGDYCFLIDAEGHVADDALGDALRNIHMKHGRVKFLGSYPSAVVGRRAAADAQPLADADRWLADLRRRIR